MTGASFSQAHLGFIACLALSISNAGSVLEWSIAFIFTLYIASFVVDLRPAAHTHKHQYDYGMETRAGMNYGRRL